MPGIRGASQGIGGGRNGSTESYAVQDPYDLEAEYGPLAWDRRHVFVANYMWELPFFKNGQSFRKMAGVGR